MALPILLESLRRKPSASDREASRRIPAHPDVLVQHFERASPQRGLIHRQQRQLLETLFVAIANCRINVTSQFIKPASLKSIARNTRRLAPISNCVTRACGTRWRSRSWSERRTYTRLEQWDAIMREDEVCFRATTEDYV